MKKIFLSVEEAADATTLGRSTLLTMAYAGSIPSVKIGRRRLFPVDELERWVADRIALGLGEVLPTKVVEEDNLTRPKGRRRHD